MVYSYQNYLRIKGLLDRLFSLWVSNHIGQIGRKSVVGYPCLIEGGGEKNIIIGDNTIIQGHSVLGCWAKYRNQSFTPSITIGNHCNIGAYNQISSIGSIVIGDGLLTGRFVIITDNNHGELSETDNHYPPAKRELRSKGEIVIGRNVWIGDKATILSNVHIGDGAIVAANAVVTKDVPEGALVAGIPAKVVKEVQ